MMALRLALADLRRDWAVVGCQVIAITVVLMPLLVLLGLKTGIIEGILERMRRDPANLQLRLVGNLGLDEAGFARLAGLPEAGFAVPMYLSAGQRQRVAIARAVVHRPSFILADEPTANLDPAAALKAMVLLGDLVRDTGAALLVVSHDRELIERAELEPAVMASERAEGSWRSVVASPERVPA